VEEGQIVDEAIGQRYLLRPQGPLTHTENRDKLFPRPCHCRHAHQPQEHGGHEYAPPLVLYAHTFLLHRHLPLYCFNSFFSSVRKRQSVPWALSFCGLLLSSPASWRRRA